LGISFLLPFRIDVYLSGKHSPTIKVPVLN